MKTLLSTIVLFTFFSMKVSAQTSEFIPSEILDNHQTEFILYHLDDKFELHSCISDSLYVDHLMRPPKEGKRQINGGKSDKTPMAVTGGQWTDECLIVHYYDSELPDSDWVDLLVEITILKADQIKLIHK